jgi:RimJ/RimL family protein N-acetyltransferase
MTPEERLKIITEFRKNTHSGASLDFIPYRNEFATDVINLRNTERGMAMLGLGKKLDIESQSKWYESYLSRNDDIYWCIFLKSGEFAGTVRIYDICSDGSVCERGSLIVREDLVLPSGFMIELEFIVHDVIFNILKMEKIVGTVLPENKRVFKYNKFLGYIPTGLKNINNVDFETIEMTKDDYKKSIINKKKA